MYHFYRDEFSNLIVRPHIHTSDKSLPTEKQLIAPKTKIFHLIKRNFPLHTVILCQHYLFAFLKTSDDIYLPYSRNSTILLNSS
jgi:hypothetical protein